MLLAAAPIINLVIAPITGESFSGCSCPCSSDTSEHIWSRQRGPTDCDGGTDDRLATA
ncbi:hypothetical protein PF002_g11293 [Phytophthora fragariae]|uniref:Uncharacterized protein n=1 Tax=Phytophthora fragariae TaxID=53985 RepID=A0A6A3ZHC7_9STRA|nr:hypothetical protein PF002_g11293 [Phytophthora fragariae]